jgi:hypothetical protein
MDAQHLHRQLQGADDEWPAIKSGEPRICSGDLAG